MFCQLICFALSQCLQREDVEFQAWLHKSRVAASCTLLVLLSVLPLRTTLSHQAGFCELTPLVLGSSYYSSSSPFQSLIADTENPFFSLTPRLAWNSLVFS